MNFFDGETQREMQDLYINSATYCVANIICNGNSGKLYLEIKFADPAQTDPIDPTAIKMAGMLYVNINDPNFIRRHNVGRYNKKITNLIPQYLIYDTLEQMSFGDLLCGLAHEYNLEKIYYVYDGKKYLVYKLQISGELLYAESMGNHAELDLNLLKKYVM